MPTSGVYRPTSTGTQEWEHGGYANVDSGTYSTTSPDISGNQYMQDEDKPGNTTSQVLSDTITQDWTVSKVYFVWWRKTESTVSTTRTWEYKIGAGAWTAFSLSGADSQSTSTTAAGVWYRRYQDSLSLDISTGIQFRFTADVGSMYDGEASDLYAGVYWYFDYSEDSGEVSIGGAQQSLAYIGSSIILPPWYGIR